MSNFNVENLRFWGKNPRYTKNDDVVIKEIGKDDVNEKIREYKTNVSNNS